MAVDFRELEKFRDKLGNLAKEIPELEKSCANELGARLIRSVKQKTPVGIYPSESGKAGGTLRRNWQIQGTRALTGRYEIDITNNTEYASYVEYGHRQDVGRYVPAIGKRLKNPWVEGRHMLRDSETELKAKAQTITDKRVEKWVEAKLNGK